VRLIERFVIELRAENLAKRPLHLRICFLVRFSISSDASSSVLYLEVPTLIAETAVAVDASPKAKAGDACRAVERARLAVAVENQRMVFGSKLGHHSVAID
jgi:hypothetical protein